MKTPSPSNLWHPCPAGLIRHVANRQEIEYRRRFTVNSFTTVVLLFAAIFGVNDHFVGRTKLSESRELDNPQLHTIASQRILERLPDHLDQKTSDRRQVVTIEKPLQNCP